MLFPAFKYELEGIVFETNTPKYDTKLSFKGEVTLQKHGIITGGLTFTKEGVEAEYKKEADGAFNELFSKSSAKFSNGRAEVSLAIGSTLKSGSQVLATTDISILPPNGSKYTYKGQEAKGTYQDYEFGGLMGYELEVHYKPSEPRQADLVDVTNWSRVIGIAAVAGAAVIVIVDLGKDIGTLGAGSVESPLSWAAAAALFEKGVAMMRSVKP